MPNPSNEKTRWVTVGRMWIDRNSKVPTFDLKLGGMLSLGILGEIPVRLRFDSKSENNWVDLYVPVDALPLNQIRQMFGMMKPVATETANQSQQPSAWTALQDAEQSNSGSPW